MALYDSIIYTVPIAFIYYGLKRGQKMEWILIRLRDKLIPRIYTCTVPTEVYWTAIHLVKSARQKLNACSWEHFPNISWALAVFNVLVSTCVQHFCLMCKTQWNKLTNNNYHRWRIALELHKGGSPMKWCKWWYCQTLLEVSEIIL